METSMEAVETSMEAVEVEIEKNQELEVSLSIEEAKGSEDVDSAIDAKVEESQPTADQAPKEAAKSLKLNLHFSTSFHTHVVALAAPAETPEDQERVATLKEIATALVEACMKREEAEVARIAAESEIRIRNGVEKAENCKADPVKEAAEDKKEEVESMETEESSQPTVVAEKIAEPAKEEEKKAEDAMPQAKSADNTVLPEGEVIGAQLEEKSEGMDKRISTLTRDIRLAKRIRGEDQAEEDAKVSEAAEKEEPIAKKVRGEDLVEKQAETVEIAPGDEIPMEFEAKAAETEEKTDKGGGQPMEVAAKAPETEVKAPETEVKAPETELKALETEKASETEVKAPETEK